eukprot:9396757-Pyramimonas_sp.AAC.1
MISSARGGIVDLLASVGTPCGGGVAFLPSRRPRRRTSAAAATGRPPQPLGVGGGHHPPGHARSRQGRESVPCAWD